MTVTLSVPELPLTAEQFEHVETPEGARLELWEGEVVMMAAAQMAWHSKVAHRIANMFVAAGREAICEVGVVVGRRTVMIPDVTVFTERVDLRRSQFPADIVSCVVEVLSPESRRRDTQLKPDVYASVGVPEFWRVTEHAEDPYDAVVWIFRLDPAQAYVLAAKHNLSTLEKTGL
jgi:Uma2 family endonuclease